MTKIGLAAKVAALSLTIVIISSASHAQERSSGRTGQGPAVSDDDLGSFEDRAGDTERPGRDRDTGSRERGDRRDDRSYGDFRRDGDRFRRGGRMIRGHAGLCGPRGARMIERMLHRLERITDPTEAQRTTFDRLKDAASRAREIMQSGCPTERAMTPTGRLAATEKRLETMLEAVRAIRPALEDYFAQLSEEQKARIYAAMAWRHQRGDFRHRHHHRRYRDWGDDRRRDDDQDRSERRGRGGGERDRDDGWPDPWRGRS